jgi:hypothetical protein
MEETMKIRHIVSATFFIVFIFIASLAIRLGVFKPVVFDTHDYGPLTLIYKNHVGPYHKLNSTITEIEAWTKAQGISCDKTFGEYLDDPKAVEQERLKSNGGCLVDAASIQQLTPEILKDYKTKTIDRRQYLRGTFSGSPAIGPYKVYMKAASLSEKKGFLFDGPTIEVYKVTGQDSMDTEYLFPVKLKY